MKNSTSKLTQSVHAGSRGDQLHGGVVAPIFTSSAYDYEELPETQYPRYFNTPNQKSVAEKIAALENAERGLVFSSGLAAIMTSLLAYLKSGDHAIFQNDLYGGSFNAIVTELPRFGIEVTMVDGQNPENFRKAIRKETRVIYIETPSNPTLKITDIKAVAAIARENGIATIIDNTFASPVNQNPHDLGIDIVTHSGTKYLGGHSDLCCGTVTGSAAVVDRVWNSAFHFGGSLDAQACYLLERSLKTIVLRVRKQNENALALATWLSNDARVTRVYYPGLSNHPDHEIAKGQMPGGFGGMMSFDVAGDANKFLSSLQLIKRAISLGSVESTICSPVKTSHAKMTEEERLKIGVTDKLVRFSVGIEETNDLIADLDQALS